MNSKYATVGNRAPSKPKPMWGVTKRSLRFGDFKVAFAFLAATAIFTVVSVMTSGETADGMKFFAWVAGIIGVLATFSAIGIPEREMNSEMRDRRIAWESNELIPYLEKKYNVEFPKTREDSSIITGITYKHAYLKDQGRSAFIKIIGVVANGGYDGGEYEYEILGDIEMEELIHQPETFSRRSLPVHNQ